MSYVHNTEKERSIIEFKRGYHLVTAPGGCGKTTILTQRVIDFLKDERNRGSRLLCVTFTKAAAEEMLSGIRKALGKDIHSSANELGKFVYADTDRDICTLHAVSKRLLEYYWYKYYHADYQVGREKYTVLTDADSKQLISEAFYNVMSSPKHRKTNSRYGLLKKFKDHPLSLICDSGQRDNVENLYYEAARRLYHTNRQKKIGFPDELLLYPEYQEGKVPGIKKTNQKLISDAAIELERLKLILKNVDEKVCFEDKFITYLSDFDDLLCILWDFLNKSKIPPCYDWVQVDEVQDLSALQLDIIKRLTRKDEKDEKVVNETVVYYGDINQAIFSFMGGCPENIMSIRNEVEKKGGDVTCLNINHRSSPKLIQYQNHFINAFFKDFNGGKSNLVADGEIKDIDNPIEIRRYPTDTKQNSEVVKMAISLHKENPSQLIAILCRTNSECIKFENAFMKKGISAYRLSDELFSSMGDIREALDELGSKYADGFPDGISIFRNLKDILIHEGSKNPSIVSYFLNYAKSLEEKALYKDPSNLLKALSNISFEEVCCSISSGIIISTVHKAKGKSFDTVFVPSVVEGEYPYASSTRKEAIMEDARLFYVAISRARQKLVLTYFDKGHITYKKTEPLKKTCGKHKKAKVSVRTHLAADKIIETKPSRFIVRPRGILCIE